MGALDVVVKMFLASFFLMNEFDAIDLSLNQVVNRLTLKYGSIYTVKNVVISGTHTHSGPAGFLQYLLFTITSLGWVQQSFDALVNGIVLVIF